MKKYPFTEGEHYFTIEDNTIVESVWDDISEQLHTKSQVYFKTLEEAKQFANDINIKFSLL